MSDNKLTCKPSDREAANKCSNSHFDNPSEQSIPPHAPKRRKSSSNDSKKAKVDRDAQESKAASKPMPSESQPHAMKENPKERADQNGQSIPVSSETEPEDNADKASQKLPIYFSAGKEYGETTEEKRQSTPGSSGGKQDQGQKADETGQSIPTASAEEEGQNADETEDSCPFNSEGQNADETEDSCPFNSEGQNADETEDSCPFNSEKEFEETADKPGESNPDSTGNETGQKEDETGQPIPNSSGNEHGEVVDKTGQSNPISPGEEQGQNADETDQSIPASEEEHGGNSDETEDSYPFNSEEEYGESADETGQSYPASPEEEYGGNEDETGQPFPTYPGEEYGEGSGETGRPIPNYGGEEDGEGADEADDDGSSPPHLYSPLGQQAAPAEPKNIFDVTPFVLPAWAEEFKATRCAKTNDSAFPNPSFYRRYCSTQVYFSRCCESGGQFYGNKPFNESYCNELLRKYREPHVSFTKEGPLEGKNESAPTHTPNPSKTNTVNANNQKKEDEEPGCCKCCCCCWCCCKWYSWIIWLILLINVLVLAYIIWWEGCGLVVLVFEDMTNWKKYNFFKWAKDILGVDYTMQLFLAFLGYFVYFCLVCCCYIYCKKCTIPDDPKSFCTCKEVKLIIHIIYGVVMIVFLYMEVESWRYNRDKFKGQEQAKLDKEHACLGLCLYLTFALLIIGVLVFVIYSLERRQIRKRIHPETGNTQNEQNRGGMSNRPYSAPANGQPGPGNNYIPAAMIVRNVCGEVVAPIFQRPMRRAQSFTDCGFSHEVYQASAVCTD